MTGSRRSEKIKNRITTLADLVRWRLEYGYARHGPRGIEKKCPCCRQFFPVNESFFMPNPKRLDGLDYECLNCMPLVARRRERRPRHYAHRPESQPQRIAL